MRTYSFLFCLILTSSLSAQDTLLRIEGVVQFQLDPLGQLIYQDQKGRLLRRDVAADTTYIFDNSLLGEISYLDASNPFGPLLYFEDFDLVLLLDRTLNEVGRLDYRSSKVFNSSQAVARNFDNKIWLFDQGDFRLKLLDDQGAVIQKSDDLRRLLSIYEPPTQLFINASKLYAYFPGEGIAVFSNFGRFLSWAARGLELPQLLLDSGNGFSWRIGKTYHVLTHSGALQKLRLPPWSTALSQADLLLPASEGFWLQQGDCLFYLK